MLSIVLRTSVAEEISIQIMDVFVAMWKYIFSGLEDAIVKESLLKKINELIKMCE